MAAFSSDQYHPFLMDSIFLLHGVSNINMSSDLTLSQERQHWMTQTDLSLWEPYYSQNSYHDLVQNNQEWNSKFIKDSSVSDTKDVPFNQDSETSITKRQSNHEDLAGVQLDYKMQTGEEENHESHKGTSMEKRRKNRRGSSLAPVKQKRQKKSGVAKHGERKQTKKLEKKLSDQPPTGYIHVRARRGQATDSHSLAERVRREKISERMRILQRLVPGCDKLTGKALMLDEIINYVQSLQNQVEFLSMRLSSLNPTKYDFSMDLDPFMVVQEKPDNLETSRPNLHPTTFMNATQDTTPATPTATRTMSNTFPFTQDGNDHRFTPFSVSRQVLVEGQGGKWMGDQESAGRVYWEMEDQRHKNCNPCLHATAYGMSNNGPSY